MEGFPQRPERTYQHHITTDHLIRVNGAEATMNAQFLVFSSLAAPLPSRCTANQEQLHMSELPLLEPSQCVLVLVDEQAGLAFAAGSQDPQLLRSNSLAVAKTSVAFDVPVVISTSASKVYSGPLMPAFRAVLPDVVPIERRSMNLWEDDSVRGAIVATGKRTLIVAGLLTEACVSFPVLSALSEGYRVVVVADACGGLTATSHELALRRMAAAGAVMTSWLQLLLEFQRDWTRHDTYEAARAIVVDHGGGYGTGLAYARDMIKPV